MRYTCSDYRREMILMGLKRRAADPQISLPEKERLQEQIRQLEAEMGMD